MTNAHYLFIGRRTYMRKVISGLILAVVFGAAWAIELPKAATLTLVDGSGAVVGVAELKEGELELDLLAGFSGLVTVTSVDSEGNVVVYDASVAVDGTVTLIDTTTLEFVNLGEAVAAAGGRIEVSFEDEVEAEDDLDADDESEEEEDAEDEEEAEDEAEDESDEENEADEAEEGSDHAAEGDEHDDVSDSDDGSDGENGADDEEDDAAGDNDVEDEEDSDEE
jgi:hypothetical protein